jgi:sec-independent protein translocase protein TatA
VEIPAPSELLLILGVLLIVFGPKKIPEIMGGIAQGIKTFKKAMETDEIHPEAGPTPPPQITHEARDSEPSEHKVEAK